VSINRGRGGEVLEKMAMAVRQKMAVAHASRDEVGVCGCGGGRKEL